MIEKDLKKYEGKLIELGYDWKIGHKGWMMGLVYNGQCFSLSFTPQNNPSELHIMEIPIRYVVSVNEPNWKVSELEKEVLSEFISGGKLKEKLANILVKYQEPYLGAD